MKNVIDLREAARTRLPQDRWIQPIGASELPTSVRHFISAVCARTPTDAPTLERLMCDSGVVFLGKDNKPEHELGVLLCAEFLVYAPVGVAAWQKHVAIVRYGDIERVEKFKPLFGMGPLCLRWKLRPSVTPRVRGDMDLDRHFKGQYDEFILDDIKAGTRESVASFVAELITTAADNGAAPSTPTGILGA
jgi:hypothetical protein